MKYIMFAIVVLFFFSCVKDKVPLQEVPKITIYEKITGTYKVYDSNSNYQFTMNLEYIRSNSGGWDSIKFINFDNNFIYSRLQSSGSNFDFVDEKLIGLVSPFPIKDKNNKSWSIFNKTDSYFDNTWRNDTIRMCFSKHNTPWWPSESVPYLDTIIKQIAVKQH